MVRGSVQQIRCETVFVLSFLIMLASFLSMLLTRVFCRASSIPTARNTNTKARVAAAWVGMLREKDWRPVKAVQYLQRLESILGQDVCWFVWAVLAIEGASSTGHRCCYHRATRPAAWAAFASPAVLAPAAAPATQCRYTFVMKRMSPCLHLRLQ